jgi:hypothetical protein
VAEDNVPSRRVAERVGLVNRGPALDPSDGQLRLAYSDRLLEVVPADSRVWPDHAT